MKVIMIESMKSHASISDDGISFTLMKMIGRKTSYIPVIIYEEICNT